MSPRQRHCRSAVVTVAVALAAASLGLGVAGRAAAQSDDTTPTTAPPGAGGTGGSGGSGGAIKPAPLGVIITEAQIDVVLATIRHIESRDSYAIPPNKARASGAYQYIPSTWANYGGYPEAYLAPPAVQDERAAADVRNILIKWSWDVSMVPIMWYFPAASRDPSLLDQVPRPEFGNKFTIRQYQEKWMAQFAKFSGQGVAPTRHFVEPPPGGSVITLGPPIIPEELDGPLAVAFPALGPVGVAPPPACDPETDANDCLVPHDAVIFGTKLQPVLAAADGVVTQVDLGHGGSGNVSVTITDTAGYQYIYSGLNNDSPGADDDAAPDYLRVSALGRVGATVRSGQVIGFIGDSANDLEESLRDAEGEIQPHFRLRILDEKGERFDAYLSVTAAMFRQTCTVGIGPWIVPENPGAAGGGVDVPVGDAAFTITPSGQVTAIGRAALIYPTAGCTFAPLEPFGPGAGGEAELPDGWTDPIELPTKIWVAVLPEVRVFTPVYAR
jgi:hypothetical protein